jgi:hypothetical protein
MPFHKDRRHHGLLFGSLALSATFAVPAAAVAAESIPRACAELSFKSIAQMTDAAGNFETRLVLLGKTLVQDRNLKHSAGNDEGSTGSEMEEINVGTLRNALGEVTGYLLAAGNLAAVRDLMVDERDRATLERQFKLIARQIQEPLSFGLDTAESVSAMTKRPGISAEVSKIHDFMDGTRAHFAACAGLAKQ